MKLVGEDIARKSKQIHFEYHHPTNIINSVEDQQANLWIQIYRAIWNFERGK